MRPCYVQSEFIYKIYKYVICEICIIKQYLGLINYKLLKIIFFKIARFHKNYISQHEGKVVQLIQFFITHP